MKHSFPAVIAIFLAVTVGSVLFAGCGGDESSADGTSIVDGTLAEFEYTDTEMMVFGLVPANGLAALVRGVDVYLIGPVTLHTKTDSNGYFRFTGVPAGSYILRFEYGGESVTYRGESGQAATINVADGTRTVLSSVRCSGGHVNIGNIAVADIPVAPPFEEPDYYTGDPGYYYGGDTGGGGTGGGTTPATPDVTSGLIAHYEMEGNADDSSGNGNHGTDNGTFWSTNSMAGTNSAMFSDWWLSGHIELSNEANFDNVLDGQHAVTLSMWVRRDVSQGDALLVKGTDPSYGITSSMFLVHFDGVDSDRLVLDLKRGSSTTQLRVLAGGFGGVDVWQHIVVTLDGSGLASGVKMYRDGVEMSFGVTHDNLDGPVLSDDTVCIGCYRGAYIDWFFEGLIDDVRLYNRALTEAQIQYLYSNP